MLEAEGLIAGQVGRGSFVTGHSVAGCPLGPAGGLEFLARSPRYAAPGTFGRAPSGPGGEVISFEMSRPSRALFPLDEFRASCAAVLARQDLAGILQLGSPAGFEPCGATSWKMRAVSTWRSRRRSDCHQWLPEALDLIAA